MLTKKKENGNSCNKFFLLSFYIVKRQSPFVFAFSDRTQKAEEKIVVSQCLPICVWLWENDDQLVIQKI